VDDDYFDKAEMLMNEWEQKQAKSTVKYQWEYSGRAGGMCARV